MFFGISDIDFLENRILFLFLFWYFSISTFSYFSISISFLVFLNFRFLLFLISIFWKIEFFSFFIFGISRSGIFHFWYFVFGISFLIEFVMYFLKIKSNSFIFFFSRYLSGNASQLLFFIFYYGLRVDFCEARSRSTTHAFLNTIHPLQDTSRLKLELGKEEEVHENRDLQCNQ